MTLGLAAGLLASCASYEGAAPTAPDYTSVISAAVNSDARSEEARARDAARKPADVIAFSGLKPGDTVVEIAPAGGYYTAILSRVVGDDGKIIGVGPARIFEEFPQAKGGFEKYLESDPITNASYSVANLDEMTLPSGVDQVWMILYYHDTYWTGEDRDVMNKSFYDALNPGGAYIIVEHTGIPSDSEDITKTLHRMDVKPLRTEIEKVGFEWAGESDVLRNPDDPQNDSVFAEGRRGNTDRIVWKFVKPG